MADVELLVGRVERVVGEAETHQQDVLEAGAKQGAADACLDYTWTQDVAFSVASTIERIEQAIAERPDMLVVSLADPVAMKTGASRRRLAAGIPVISVNVPDPAPRGERLPYLIYIGPDEHEGGVEAARLVLAEGTPAQGGLSGQPARPRRHRGPLPRLGRDPEGGRGGDRPGRCQRRPGPGGRRR